MTTNPSSMWTRFAGIYGFLGVAAGAFGAHGLKEMVTPERLEVFQTGSRYCMIHALALLILGVYSQTQTNPWLTRAGWGFTMGTAIFSGSLWLLVLTDTGWMGAITPLGGLGLLAGWFCLILSTHRNENES